MKKHFLKFSIDLSGYSNLYEILYKCLRCRYEKHFHALLWYKILSVHNIWFIDFAYHL